MSTDPSVRRGPETWKVEDEAIQKLVELDLHANNYQNGQWGSMRHIVVKDEDAHVYKDCEHAFINTLTRGDVSSLTWFESPNQYFSEVANKKSSHELCSVYYAPINFRDIMLAYGRLPPDAIPGNFADRECLLGMEFAGRLDDGTRLMGILPAQALATTVMVDRDYAWEVPAEWTLAEASTVPVVYTTAYYALVRRGQMKKGDKVLIHGGAGGVGQAAIAIALAAGCEVFTTVGSKEKRLFLQNLFPQLQDHHFANSRSADFELHIRQHTKGRGVNIVLNSLANEMLQASLRCLARHGRFLEIGKVDLSQNSSLGMSKLLDNVSVHGILLDSIMDPTVGDIVSSKFRMNNHSSFLFLGRMEGSRKAIGTRNPQWNREASSCSCLPIRQGRGSIPIHVCWKAHWKGSHGNSYRGTVEKRCSIQDFCPSDLQNTLPSTTRLSDHRRTRRLRTRTCSMAHQPWSSQTGADLENWNPYRIPSKMCALLATNRSLCFNLDPEHLQRI